MSEKKNKIASVEEIWQGLSLEDRDFLALYSVAEWQSGTGADFLVASVGVTPEKIKEWVKKGILHEGSGKEFAQEWLNANQTKIEEAKRKDEQWKTNWNGALRTPVDKYLSGEDLNILEKMGARERIMSHREDPIRYRFISEELHDFVNSQLTEE